jgi:hypothetical protein
MTLAVREETEMPESEPLSTVWRKSRRSYPEEDCVELAMVGGAVWFRDSKDRLGPRLTYSAAGWKTFLDRVRSGELDL